MFTAAARRGLMGNARLRQGFPDIWDAVQANGRLIACHITPPSTPA